MTLLLAVRTVCALRPVRARATARDAAGARATWAPETAPPRARRAGAPAAPRARGPPLAPPRVGPLERGAQEIVPPVVHRPPPLGPVGPPLLGVAQVRRPRRSPRVVAPQRPGRVRAAPRHVNNAPPLPAPPTSGHPASGVRAP